jgi:D-glycero-alpha-D-manno-heptose 1-phosphate guanylyltransferase
VSAQPSKLTCVILAGGLGTRLASVVSNVPKPMATVAGRPFLEYLIHQAKRGGSTEVVLCIKHLAEVVESHFGDGARYGIPIRYSRERDLAGTAGALKLAENLIQSDPFVVMNGDSYCDADIAALVKAHRQSGAKATLVAVVVEDAARFGTVELTPTNAVAHFMEKTGDHRRGFINSGIYALSRDLLKLIPEGRPCSIEREIFPSLVGNDLAAMPHHGVFIDIGTPESLQQAHTILSGVAKFDAGTKS